ncbi:hypothetical protein CYB_0369 [Synechococcus sp. JA-2-3B'a(2-13)]|nr:hypothetical protein CYB_0369 [Synechococcus sp. JA-2-3B'a(2-13)]
MNVSGTVRAAGISGWRSVPWLGSIAEQQGIWIPKDLPIKSHSPQHRHSYLGFQARDQSCIQLFQGLGIPSFGQGSNQHPSQTTGPGLA